MPPDELDAASSVAETTSPPETAETQAPAADPGATTADPPSAPADDRAELLSVVQRVVQASPENPKGEGEKPAAQGDQPRTDNQAAEKLADPTDDELKALVPQTQKRIRQLLDERGAARAEAENLKPAAAKWQQMDAYLTQHDLAAEDVNLLLGVGAALRRGDFKAFRDGVMPYVELANLHLGLTIPPDLHAKVEAGEITEDAAKELSVARLTNARLTGQAKANTDAASAAEQARVQQQTASVINAAVTGWENEVRSRDPDYPRKASTVLRVSQALIAEEGRPPTAEAAVAMAKRAYDEANAMFAGMAPARVPSRPVPVGAHSVNHARAEPKSLMEAAMLGLERSRR